MVSNNLMPYLDMGLELELCLWILGKTEFRATIPEFWIWLCSRMSSGEGSRVILGLTLACLNSLRIIGSLPS